jgi:IclR family acetate operon transcriptional repressor
MRTSTITDPTIEGAVPKAFRVLEYLARSGKPLRLSAIAVALDLQKSTVHRILGSLASGGYVEQLQDTACYVATLKLWELGTGVLHEHPIKRAAAGYLQELHRATGETVSLTILSGDDVLFVDKLLSARAVKFSTRVGSRAPAALTAGGQAMLAYLPDAHARVKRTAARLKRADRFDVDAVVNELQAVRARGYSISMAIEGVIGFGAPLMDRDERPVAALSVSAPKERLSATKQKLIIERLRSTCATMSAEVRL